jgi:hypothetical protein
MPEGGGTNKPIGRARRIIGLVVLALGAILCVRMAWLFAFYQSSFGRNEWIRFVFFLWIGLFLSLLGGWLSYRWRAAGLVALFLVSAFVGLALGGHLGFW